MEQQKIYQIDFYIGLYDIDNLCDMYSFKESVDKITDCIGDCTIIPCVGSYKSPIGIRINMNSLKITKFVDNNPTEFAFYNAKLFKEMFKQNSVITNITKCCDFSFNI